MSDPSPTPKNNHRRRRRKLRRRLWIGAGLALAILLVALLARPQPVAVDVAEIVRGELLVTLDEEGETRVRDRYAVSAPLAGRVLRIDLEPGDPVAAGETVLATLQPEAPRLLDTRSTAEAEARVRAAEASLGLARAERQKAEAELRYANAELERYRRLAEESIVSEERLESAALEAETRRRAHEAADFAVRTAAHQLDQARAALAPAGNPATAAEPITITSPVDGVVLRRLRESEAVVAAGEPLLEVADPGQLEIVADFLSTDAVRIEPGSTVHVEQWGGDRPLAARVRRVEPYGFTKISALGVEEQRVNVIIDFEEPREGWAALGDGYRVEVRVVVWSGNDVLKAPASALFRHAGGWAVFTADGDRARLVPVEIGARNPLEAQVLDGLEEGADVVVHPSDELADGVGIERRG